MSTNGFTDRKKTRVDFQDSVLSCCDAFCKKAHFYELIIRSAAGRPLASSGVTSPGARPMSFTFHQSQRLGFHGKQGLSMMQSRWVDGGRGIECWTCHPWGAVRSRQRTGSRSRSQERPGGPASCHLSDTGGDHPSGRGRPRGGTERPEENLPEAPRRATLTQKRNTCATSHRAPGPI